ncbi:MAG: metal ABC transporter substrate-binding protein [Actinobacteria bacterium]|nr:metal ABC transporter substrate-binding protein [Actinomycetota bacterium]
MTTTPPWRCLTRRAVALRVCLLVIGVLVAACGSSSASPVQSNDDAAPMVVATTTILGDVATQVAGDAADVTVLLPVGADPHSFEPSAQQQAQLLDADLIVANGGGLEASLDRPLAEAADGGVPVFTAIDHVEPHTFADDGDGTVDPHFWMDPVRMAAVARALSGQLGELGVDADRLRQQGDAYATQLEDLDVELSELLADVPDDRRTLVTNHDAFGYFAERYDFRVVGTVIPGVATGAEPSAQDLEALVRTLERERVTAVFTETIAADDMARTLAQEVGSHVEVVALYSGSLDEPGSGAATYQDMLRTDARRIRDALS